MQPYADYEVNDGTEEAQEYFADIEKQLSALDAEMAALNKVGEKLISAPATYWRRRRFPRKREACTTISFRKWEKGIKTYKRAPVSRHF